MTRLTAISGGIGSGKSIVSHILAAMGYDVFDCDSEAKRIMDTSPVIKRRIHDEICAEAISLDGQINRQLLSEIVFKQTDKLDRLNSIVHKAVKEEIIRWSQKPHPYNHAFIETAILYQSGLDKIVDDVIEIIAPDEIRIQRVMLRNNCTEAQVRARIQSQTIKPENPHEKTVTITNDNLTPILPQLLAYLNH